MKINNFFIVIILMILSLSEVKAAQVKQVEDGDEFTAEISKSDLNRIKVGGDRIRDVKLNSGDLDISLDDKNGEVYVRVASHAEGKPINIFIITQQNFTYKGILYPRSIPSEQIILNNDSVAQDEVMKVSKNSYEQQIISLLQAMRNKARLESYQIQLRKKKVDLGDLEMRRSTVYKGQNFIGEIFVLENDSNQIIDLEEKFFFRNGVKAIKIEKPTLLPDDKTEILIVS